MVLLLLNQLKYVLLRSCQKTNLEALKKYNFELKTDQMILLSESQLLI